MRSWVAGLALSFALSSYAAETVVPGNLKRIQYGESVGLREVSFKLADFCKENDYEAAALLTGNGAFDIGNRPYKLVRDGQTIQSSVNIDSEVILSRAIAGLVLVYHCHPDAEDEFLLPSYSDVSTASRLLMRMKQANIPLSNIRFGVVSRKKAGVEGVEYWPNGSFRADPSRLDSQQDANHKFFEKEVPSALVSLKELNFGIENAVSFIRASDDFKMNSRHSRLFRRRLEDKLGKMTDRDAYFAYLSAASTFQFRAFGFAKDFNTESANK